MAGADSIIKYLPDLNQYEQQKVLTFLEEKLIDSDNMVLWEVL